AYERLVARRMAKAIVQRLEAIGVHDRNRQRRAVAGSELALEPLEEASSVRQPGERIGRRRRLRGLMELGDAHRGRDLMRDRREQILVLTAERGDPRALDAQCSDALVAELQRDAQHRADLGRTVEARIETTVRDVLELAALDDPPADALALRKALAHVRPGRADRGADHQMLAGVVEGEEEPVLVAHGVADDPKEPLGEVVDVQDGADLGGEPLQDRELTAVGLSARSELLEEHARSGHVFDVLVEDPRDATERGRALRAVALDEPQERVDHSRMKLSPATAQELGAGMLDGLRRLVRTAADDDLERVRGGYDVRLDRNEIAAQLVRIAGSVVPLVMAPHDRDEVSKRLDRVNDRRAKHRVAAHHDPLVG